MRLRRRDVLARIAGLAFGAVGGFGALRTLVGGRRFVFLGAETELVVLVFWVWRVGEDEVIRRHVGLTVESQPMS